MDVANLPKYWNSSNMTNPYLLQPSKLLSPDFNKFFGTGAIDGTLDSIVRKVFPNLPPNPSLVRNHGIRDAVELTEMFNKGNVHVDLGNLERGRPPVTNSAMWGLDNWNNPQPKSNIAQHIYNTSQPDYAAMGNASQGVDFTPFLGKFSALLDKKEPIIAEKSPKVAALLEKVAKTIEKNKKNNEKSAELYKSSDLLQQLRNYFSLKARPVFGKAIAEQAKDGVSVISPAFETPAVLDYLGDYIPQLKGMARSYGKRLDRGAKAEIKKNPVLINLSGESKKDISKEVGLKRNSKILGEGSSGAWDKLEEANSSPGFIPKAQELSKLIKRKAQLQGRGAERLLDKHYPDGWVLKKRFAGNSQATTQTKHPELYLSGGPDKLKQIDPRSALKDWMVQEKKQIAEPLMNRVTADLGKKLFNYGNMTGKSEYRVHSIDGKVIPGATIDRGSPIGFIKNFVPGWETSRRKMLEKYMQQALNKLPAGKKKLNYGADIAITPEGKPFLVEMNPISDEGSSGYYTHPVVIDAMRAAVKGKKNLQDITKQYVAPAGALALGGGVMYNQKNKEQPST